MTRSVVVSRKELGLSNLSLEQVNKYYIPDGTFGAGETGHRRVTSESPMVKGRYPSSVIEADRVANIGVHVMSTLENLQADCQIVIDAMSQFRYTLAWSWNGLSGTWQCEAADWAVGQSGVLDQRFLEIHTQIIYFTVPHNRISGF
jgi:hypothetical protein